MTKNLPCILNGHLPEVSEKGHPIVTMELLNESRFILPCQWCGIKIWPPKNHSGSFVRIKWEEVDGTYMEKPVKKAPVQIQWRHYNVSTTSATDSHIDIYE